MFAPAGPLILMDFERIAFQEQTEHLPQCIAGALGLGGFPSSSEFVQRGLAFFGGGRVDHLGPRLDPQPFGQQRLPQRQTQILSLRTKYSNTKQTNSHARGKCKKHREKIAF